MSGPVPTSSVKKIIYKQKIDENAEQRGKPEVVNFFINYCPCLFLRWISGLRTAPAIPAEDFKHIYLYPTDSDPLAELCAG